MRRSPFAGPILAALVLAGAAAATTSVVAPARTLPQASQVTPLGLTGRRVAFGVGVSPDECRVKLWSVSANAVTPFGVRANPTCTISTSTGSGIDSVSVASTRVAWVAHTGGNIREWSLLTASVQSPKPVRLRFVARGVDGPRPIVLGPGTPEGIPYAVGREIVYRSDDGTRLFRTLAPGPVRLVAAGPGPAGIRVVALTADGRILSLTGDGSPAADDIVPEGGVAALRLLAAGVAYQVGTVVHVVGPGVEQQVTLPARATMVDAAAGRVLYQRRGALGAVVLSTGEDVPLVEGSPRAPVLGQLEPSGLAWANGSTVFWRPGPLPTG